MTALKIIGIVFLILLLIGLLRIGAVISFGEGIVVKLRIGPLRLTLFPKKNKKPKKQKAPKEKPAEDNKEKKQRKLPKLTIEDLFDLISAVSDSLGGMLRSICKRLRIDPLELTAVFGGTDPAEIAQTYGVANAFVWTFMPRAEEIFFLPNPVIHLGMDYEAEMTRCEGTIGFSVRICDIIAIAAALVLPLVKWFLRFKKLHANDPKPTEVSPEKVTEKLSA